MANKLLVFEHAAFQQCLRSARDGGALPAEREDSDHGQADPHHARGQVAVDAEDFASIFEFLLAEHSNAAEDRSNERSVKQQNITRHVCAKQDPTSNRQQN